MHSAIGIIPNDI